MWTSNRTKGRVRICYTLFTLLFVSSLNDTTILYKYLQKCPKAKMNKPYSSKYGYTYICMYICMKIHV